MRQSLANGCRWAGRWWHSGEMVGHSSGSAYHVEGEITQSCHLARPLTSPPLGNPVLSNLISDSLQHSFAARALQYHTEADSRLQTKRIGEALLLIQGTAPM